MKRLVSILLAVVMLLGAIPALAAPMPYVVLSEFNDGETMGVVVKPNEKFSGDFTLIAALCKDDTVLEVKTVTKAELGEGHDITFDSVDGSEIKLYTWKSVASMVPAKENYLDSVTYEEVMAQLKMANDYWITQNNTLRANTNPWQVGVYHTGNMQAYYMTGDEAYRNYSTLWSQVNFWDHFGTDNIFADNLCCYQTYLDLYNIDKDESYITNVEKDINSILNSYAVSYWYWIDAFYMAAPIFTKMYELTGDTAYLDKMYKMVKYAAETINCYDEEVGLWFRDASFINDISENGEHVYWSRGDGWVYGAFARIIEEMPDSYAHKDYFVDIFCEMSAALKKTQCSEGAWHESLMDPDYNPDCEESGTGFFVYGLMWGINNGYLDEDEYIDCVARGWKWLSEVALQENGHIGYVQSIGAMPTKVELTSSMTENYAYANFVFAASEIAKHLGGMQGDILPYLQKKLLGNIEVYKTDSVYAIKNGEIVTGDTAWLTDEGVYNGNGYIALTDYVPEGMYVYKDGDICVISEFITPFNKTEANLVTMLSDILSVGKFPERPYSDPERLDIEAVFTLQPASRVDNLLIVPVTNVTSNYVVTNSKPHTLIDRDLTTYFNTSILDKNNLPYVEFDFMQDYSINKIGIAFNNGDSEQNEFSVSVSSDGETYTEVLGVTKASGTTKDIEYYEFDNTTATYVRIYGYGSASSIRFNPSEVEIYSPNGGGEVGTEILKKTKISIDGKNDVLASAIIEEENGPENAFDNNVYTYATLRSDEVNNPEYIQVDLGETEELSRIGLVFRYGFERQYIFRVSVSEDGNSFTDVIPKTYSTGVANTTEYYSLGNVTARYIRLYGYGWAQSSTVRNVWFSLGEMKLYGTKINTEGEGEDVEEILPMPGILTEPDMTNLTSAEFTVTQSVIPQIENGPDNVTDGDFGTYGTLFVEDRTNPQYMDFDLGRVEDVSHVALAFLRGDTRTIVFHIEVSEDGVNYTEVIPKSSTTGTTNGYEYFEIGQSARYVRVYGYYNSFNDWISITEAEVYVK